MLDRLKRKAQLNAIEAAEKDIERFLKSLRGAGIEELATIVVTATHWRNVFAERGINLLDPMEAERKKPDLGLLINKLLREVQKEKPAMVTGLMVWLHSVRAANIPEIRKQGRELWAELARAFDQAPEKVAILEPLAGMPLLAGGPAQIPLGLEAERL